MKFVMVDPKRVELTAYNGIPHLVAPVVVDLDRVVGTLQWAMREMDNRYKGLSEMGARNIGEYNRKGGRQRRRDFALYCHRHRRIGRPDDAVTRGNRARHHPTGPDGKGNRHPHGHRNTTAVSRRRHRSDQS